MGKFLSSQATAAALIAKNGSPVTLKRTVSTGFDPVTQSENASVETYVFQAVIIPPTRQAQFTVGTLEGRNAVECYFALKDQFTVPQPGDVIAVNGVDHKIFYAQTYNPALDGPIMTLAYAERGS